MNTFQSIALSGLLFSASMLASPFRATGGPGDDKAGELTASNVSRTKTMGVAIYQSVNTSTMNLMIENYIEVPLKVRLLDETNAILHEEVVSKRLKSYRRKFNMEQVKDGSYTFEITDGFNRVVKTFRVDTPEVTVNQTGRFISLEN